jgi:histidine triad (HIT) family protein
MIEGKIPYSKVYEDNNFLAILDIRPVSLGHILLIPKKHHINVKDIPADLAKEVYPVVQKLSLALIESLKCDGINLVQNNGEAAGQEIFHGHLHLVPRYKNDGIKFGAIHKEYENQEQMDEYAEKIRNNIKL